MFNPRIHFKPLVFCTALAALGLTTGLAVSSKRHGTDILHLFARKTMTNGGTVTNATGRVEVHQNKQGNANNQRLEIVLKNLQTNTAYQLFALLDDDTNWTYVADLQSDANGAAALRYRKVGSSKGKGGGLGKGKTALPGALDPLSDIRELSISVNTTQSVLHADLTAPNKLQYLVKRDLSTSTVDAQLHLKATVNQTRFKLAASGLNPSSDYLLALNGSIVQTNASDAGGKLLINSLVENPGDILDLHNVELWDSSGSNVVLSTTLP